MQKQSNVSGDYTAFVDNDNLTVYYSPTCSVCIKLADYLDGNNVRYTKKNIDESAVYETEFNQLNFRVVPLILTKDNAILAFHKDEVDELLKNYRF